MFKCKRLGFEEDEGESIKIPSEPSGISVPVGGVRSWGAEERENGILERLKRMPLVRARSSIPEPQRVGVGSAARVPPSRRLAASL